MPFFRQIYASHESSESKMACFILVYGFTADTNFSKQIQRSRMITCWISKNTHAKIEFNAHMLIYVE